jgi:glucose-6-phosphate isomerase
LSLPELNAFYLGQLIGFYEASVMIQGLFLNINSFDQWGVELGKKTALNILRNLREEIEQDFDSSTNKQIADYKKISP